MATTINSGYANSPKLTANIADHADVFGGRALVFDGVTDYLLSDDNGNTMGMGSNPFSISAWVKFDDVTTHGASNTWFSAGSGSSQPRFQLQLYILHSTTYLRAVYEKSGSDLTITVTEPMDTGWHHLVFVEESDTSRKFYKDGELIDNNTTSFSPDTNYVDYVIGANRTTNVVYHLNGSMSDVKLFKLPLQKHK